MNVNLPHLIEMLCSVAIVWANLAYLMVTLPLLLARLRRTGSRPSRIARRVLDLRHDGDAGPHDTPRPDFSLGRFGLPINAIAVVWGLSVVINIGWPRPEIYGSDHWGRFAAPLATLALIVPGATYFLLFQRKRTGILAELAATEIPDGPNESSSCQLPVASCQ